MKQLKVTALLMSMLLAACGGGGGGYTEGDDDGGDGGGPDTVSLRAGILGDSGNFTQGSIAVTSSDLSAGGQTGLRVDIVNQTGDLAAGTTAVVAFSSPCLSSGLSTITPSTVTTVTGRADATYVAQGCSGTDSITATVTSEADSSINGASGSVTVQAAALGGLSFVSATPATIGMSGSPIARQSVVVFKVTNAAAGVVPNQRVTFSLSTAQGGITVTPNEATSDSQGLVQTVVSAGSARAVVRVIASAQNATSGTTITTTSEQLTISTGLPDQDSFSLAANKLSVEGACDGEPVNITIRAADRYNNPVPAGTAISFTTEGGKINAQCFTGDPLADPSTEAGVCSVLLTVQAPRPANGRVSVLATAVGEESFDDDNGNGYYDSGESFEDLGEAFVDYNENGGRDSGEPPIDFNNDGVFQSAGDGAFTGYVCDSPGVNCRSNTLSVRRRIEIVFSTTTPTLNQLNVATTAPSTWDGDTLRFVGAKSIAFVTAVVRDSSGNPLPTGTTYELKTTSGSVVEPATVGPFNTNSQSTAANSFSFSLQAPDGTEPDNGLVSLVVHIPATACYTAKDVTIPLFQASYTPLP